MSERVLVTGGAGYFGSLLVERLAARGDRVRVLDIHDAGALPAGVEMVQGDIRDPLAVAKALAGIEVVHHCVAQVPLAKDRAAFHSVNVEGTRLLLEASAKSGVRKLVHMSSSAVYGIPERTPVDDSVIPRPREAYGEAKWKAELLCQEAVARGLDVTIVRPRTILGHGRLGILQILFEWIRSGRNVPVLGRGGNLYQFVHAADLGEVCVKAAARPGPATYNAGAERFGTMYQALARLCAEAGTGSRVIGVPMAPAVALMKLTSALGLSPLGDYHALMYGRTMYFDIHRTMAELDWRPQYGNEEMLLESYRWYLAHRDSVLASGGKDSPGSPHRRPVRQGVLGLASRLFSLWPPLEGPGGD